MTTSELLLEPRAIHRIADAAALQVTCREGSVWITLDGDPRDIVLEAGECFSTREHRRALIYAFGRARLRLSPLAAPATAARSRVQPCVPAAAAVDFAR
ncbi:MAG: DUF2917 domain-containing protein [Comamonadaceae bacterium]|nr:MAG: DUF2917 domain-containing protein [Comamonadaceae bacterium]